jgi:hypothetical protein
MTYLQTHEEGRRIRKLKECERIREEEKMDRLAEGKEEEVWPTEDLQGREH